MGKLQGKTALVIGGTSGIGLATVKRFHAEGARVIATGSTAASVDAASSELRSIAEVMRSDAGDVRAIDALFAHVGSQYHGLDALFYNAGIVRSILLVDMDEPTYDRMFATNVKGALFAVRAATPLLRRGGAVVLCGSINGHIGMAGSAAYAASKGAIHAFARVAATELAPRGVRVNVVSPGPTDSGIIEKMGMSRTQTDAVKSHLAEQIAMKRLGTVDEIARAALFLVSDDSAFMTGQELLIDGGLTLGAAST